MAQEGQDCVELGDLIICPPDERWQAFHMEINDTPRAALTGPSGMDTGIVVASPEEARAVRDAESLVDLLRGGVEASAAPFGARVFSAEAVRFHIPAADATSNGVLLSVGMTEDGARPEVRSVLSDETATYLVFTGTVSGGTTSAEVIAAHEAVLAAIRLSGHRE
jgi:hypothetical protein